MLKYVDTAVTFAEIPDEISLCINISNCPCHCKECHSSYLAEDIGKPLQDDLDMLIKSNSGISCVCFMGGDQDPWGVCSLVRYIKMYYPNIKTAWYSGRSELPKKLPIEEYDYIKLGPYIPELGPLTSKITNQRLYQICNMASLVENSPRYEMIDITYKFWGNVT